MNKKSIFIYCSVIILIFSFCVFMTENDYEDSIETNAGTALSNKKIGWGIKREKDNKQPDLGKVNAELINKYDGYCMGNSEKKYIYITFDEGYEAGHTEKILDTLKENNVKDKPVYWVSNNWIHTNINHGDIVVRYRAIPYEYDSETNMTFPLIYNDELLKLAIKLYVLKMMLNRGYVHPIQNLKDNNPFTNPALYLEQIRFKVRTSCNKFTKDRREILANINTTMLWK